jgi:hypothetical protein
MTQPDQENQSSARWWEFYAVRYGMGSVVGAIIFFFLCNTNPVLKPMGNPPTKRARSEVEFST